MGGLVDKVALVVGGAGGIGLAIAERFAAEGAEVFVTGRRQADLDDAARRIGARAHPVRADASDPRDLERAVATIRSERGRIDVLVVNAGLSEPAPLGGHPGVRFTYHYTVQDEDVRRRGEGRAAIVGGQLYLITFAAPEIHYFDAGIAEARRVMDSARIPGASVTATKAKES